jgi:hypothetical protein
VSHQLHDDRRRNVRHDSECENREARQGASGKHVEHAKDAALLLLEQLAQSLRINAWHGNMRPNPVNDQCPEQEPQPALEVAKLSTLANRARTSCQKRSPLPAH